MVSSDAARLGSVGRGMAWLVMARFGTLCCVTARSVMVGLGQARLGQVCQCGAWPGAAGQGVVGFVAAWSGRVRQATFWRGRVWHGKAVHGWARSGSAGYGVVRRGVGLFWRGWVRHGVAS